MSELRTFADQYLFPTLVAIFGLIFFLASLVTGQNMLVVICALAITVAGVIYLLYVLGKISRKFQTILTAVSLVGSIVLAFGLYSSIKNPIDYRENKALFDGKVKQQLKDIRAIQLAYKQKFGLYTSSFDSLINFAKFDSLVEIKAEGSRPDSVATDAEAVAMGLIVRDTFLVDVMGKVFPKSKEADRKFPLSIDSLPYDPWQGNKFKMVAKFKKDDKGVNRAMLLVQDPNPYHKKGFPITEDTLRVGSLDEFHTNGSWGGK